jgi:spermidine synthase
MIPRTLIATALVPGGEPLRLFQRGDDYMIVLERNELMNSRMSGSEEVLATGAIARLAGRSAPHVLIGGYGMGFTLRAALAELDKDALVTVAELVPEIIDWAHGPMAALTAGCLDDPRVGLLMTDVAAAIGRAQGLYDAILLDVDNGPDGLSRVGNNRLYSHMGLETARRALAPGGVLAVWSAAPDKAFARRLRDAGFAVEEITTPARSNGKGAKHTIWFAVRD